MRPARFERATFWFVERVSACLLIAKTYYLLPLEPGWTVYYLPLFTLIILNFRCRFVAVLLEPVFSAGIYLPPCAYSVAQAERGCGYSEPPSLAKYRM